jgi:hypothetical protein
MRYKLSLGRQLDVITQDSRRSCLDEKRCFAVPHMLYQTGRLADCAGRHPVQPNNSAIRRFFLSPFKSTAASLGVEAIVAPVRNRSEMELAIATQARAPNSAIAVMTDSFTSVHRAEITSLATQYRLPAIYPYRFFVKIGGLLSYGNDDLLDNFRRTATFGAGCFLGTEETLRLREGLLTCALVT